jgi:protein pelota
MLTINVKKIDFDSQAGQLHINGQVCEENQIVSVGAYHTLDLELHRNFTIFKAEWDSITLGVIKEACDPGERAEIGAVVLQEGMANVCFITEHMTVLRQRIETPIPKKRLGSSTNYEKVYYTLHVCLVPH